MPDGLADGAYDPAFTEEANARAKELLRQMLSRRQRRDFDAHRAFTVRGSDGRRYRIGWGRFFNVHETRIRGRKRGWCAFSPKMPLPEVMLAQKLLLEADAEEFRSIAAPSSALSRSGGIDSKRSLKVRAIGWAWCMGLLGTAVAHKSGLL